MDRDTPIILVVHSDREEVPQHWESRFEHAGVSAEWTIDVYRALARLGRTTALPAAVLVCVDYLDATEFEFFDLVSRYHRSTVTYAYGGTQASDKLDAAVRAGAHHVLTSDRFETLLEELVSRTGEPVGNTSPSRPEEQDRMAGRTRDPVPPAEPATQSVVGHACNDTPEPTRATPDEDEPPPPRFPWRRDTAGPVRTPPVRRERPATVEPAPDASDTVPEHASPGGELEDDIFEGPLLSPEELELLMKDDFRTRPTDSSQSEEGSD